LDVEQTLNPSAETIFPQETNSMWNIKKYSAMAIVGTGLAFAAASPASACGAFGMVGAPVFGAAFGGCGAYGLAAPVAFGWGGGCMPVAFGCGGGYGSYGYAPTYGYARPYYGAYGAGYGGGGCGCGYGYHPGAYGFAWRRPIGFGMAWHRPIGFGIAWRRPIGFGVAFHRRIGFGVAFHRPMRVFASYRSYRPSRFAYGMRSYHRGHLYASYGMRHHFAMRYGTLRG
jgi:hypothetical protein